MERKFINLTQDIILENNVLNIVNKNIEKFGVNNKILLLTDYYHFFKYKFEIKNLIKSSLNFIDLKIIYNLNTSILENISKNLNETYFFVISFGGAELIRLTKKLTIKNNINTAYIIDKFENFDFFISFLTDFDKLLDLNTNNPAIIFCEKTKILKTVDELFNFECSLIINKFYIMFNKINDYIFKNNNLESINNLDINSVIGDGTKLQNNKNFNFLDKILYLSGFKNNNFNKILICCLLANFILAIIKSVTQNNVKPINYKKIKEILEENNLKSESNNYFKRINLINNHKEKENNKLLFKIISLKEKLILNINFFNNNIKENLNKMKILNIEKFYILSKNFNYKKILEGLKIYSFLEKNENLFTLIRDFGYLT